MDRAKMVRGIREFLEGLDSRDGRPFFAFLNYFDAHTAYWSPPEYRERFTERDPRMNRYDAAIRYTDDEVFSLLE